MGEAAKLRFDDRGDCVETHHQRSNSENSSYREAFIADLRREIDLMFRFSVAHMILFSVSMAYVARQWIEGNSFSVFVAVIAVLNAYWLATSIKEIGFLKDRIAILSGSKHERLAKCEAAAFSYWA